MAGAQLKLHWEGADRYSTVGWGRQAGTGETHEGNLKGGKKTMEET